MMKKILVLLTLVILAMGLTACGSGNGSDTNPVKPFVGGTKGVAMEFMQGAPPDMVLDAGQTSFPVQMKLTNEGEQDIKPDENIGYLEASLEGIVPQQFGLPAGDDLTRELDENLLGANKYSNGVRSGSSAILSWNGLSYPSDVQGATEKSFLLNLCYDYKTMSTTSVCLSGDSSSAAYDEQSKDICDITAPKTTYNSGGPVHVENVRQNTAGSNKVSIMFDVVHVGEGAVYEFGEAECDPSLQNRQDKGVVDVSLSLPSSTPATISCGSNWAGDGSKTVSGDVKLLGSKSSGEESGGRSSTTVHCVLQSNAGDTTVYEELLSINLKYRYSQNLRKTITVEDMGASSDDSNGGGGSSTRTG